MANRQYIIDKNLEESEVKDMQKDELERFYKWAKKDIDTYYENRADKTHKTIFGSNFMPSGGRKEVVQKNKMYNDEHEDEKERVFQNLRLIERYGDKIGKKRGL